MATAWPAELADWSLHLPMVPAQGVTLLVKTAHSRKEGIMDTSCCGEAFLNPFHLLMVDPWAWPKKE